MQRDAHTARCTDCSQFTETKFTETELQSSDIICCKNIDNKSQRVGFWGHPVYYVTSGVFRGGEPAAAAPPPLGDILTPSLTVMLANAKF